MMKGLEIIQLCRKISAIPLSRTIRTDSVLLANVRRRTIPRRNPDEPGIRRRRFLFQNKDEDIREEMEDEGDLEDEVDFMNIDRAYDVNKSEWSRNKRKVQYAITAKKFFAPRPQPPMLTCNERVCIRNLHKEDPVQWNIKTLSESFPATPDTIKKIIKGKWKVTPERAKTIDKIVQKNWERLAEGTLDAEPHLLEHFKRFINRREVLLEQLKNSDFYLPEVKKERVWNGGEFSDVLRKYERDVEQLVKETETEQQPKMLKDGMEMMDGEEDKSSLDLIHAKIESAVSQRPVEEKDSFMFREMTKFYSKHTTLEDLENRILKRADARKNLDVVDKAILEVKFGLRGEKNVENSSKTVPSSESIQSEMDKSLETEKNSFMRFDKNEFVMGENGMGPREEDMEEKEFKEMRRSRRFNRIKPEEGEVEEMEFKNTRRSRRMRSQKDEEMEEMEFRNFRGSRRFNKIRPREEEEEVDSKERLFSFDDRTLRASESDIGKVLLNLRNPPPKGETKTESKKVEEKPKIDFSDPERLRRENIYYDNEVRDIENTAFWNSGRTSKEKAMAELEKRPHDGPDWVVSKPDVNRASTAILSQDPYPEKIKIPRDKRRSGLIFKVKDCYYDDDGEFLYRVPGMAK